MVLKKFLDILPRCVLYTFMSAAPDITTEQPGTAPRGPDALVDLVRRLLAFGLLNTQTAGLVFLAILLSMPVHDMQYGPQAALIAESFPSRVRYTGSSLGYQLSSITAGGPAPIVALYLYQTYHSSTPIAVYLVICSIISLVCVRLLPSGQHEEL